MLESMKQILNLKETANDSEIEWPIKDSFLFFDYVIFVQTPLGQNVFRLYLYRLSLVNVTLLTKNIFLWHTIADDIIHKQYIYFRINLCDVIARSRLFSNHVESLFL